ncbi:MAG: hypothetical protein AB7T31_07980 [Gemmatimonadales bacterium]
MSPHEVPEQAQRLILEAIDSVAELEALLLLRETSGQRWTVEAASERLYVNSSVAAEALDALARRGFLRQTQEGFSYAPASPDLAEDVTTLAHAYSASLIAVTHLIHSKPSSSVQDFARAFRFRKER